MIGTLSRPALSQAQTGGRRTSGRPSGLVAAFALLVVAALFALATSGDLATVPPVALAALVAFAVGFVAVVRRRATARLPLEPIEPLSPSDLAARLGIELVSEEPSLAARAPSLAAPEAPLISEALDAGTIRQRVLAETILALGARGLDTPRPGAPSRDRPLLAAVWSVLLGSLAIRTLGLGGGFAAAFDAVAVVTLLLLGLGLAFLFRTDERTIQHLKVAADTDPITGLYNIRAFRRIVGMRTRRSPTAEPWAIAFIDLDDFKSVNERLGHPAGDRALGLVATALRANSRHGDVVARYGGDEFIVFLDRSEPREAERVIRRVERSASALSEAAGIPVRFSAGIAGATPSCHRLSDVIERADQMLRHVKRAGKHAIRTKDVFA